MAPELRTDLDYIQLDLATVELVELHGHRFHPLDHLWLYVLPHFRLRKPFLAS